MDIVFLLCVDLIPVDENDPISCSANKTCEVLNAVQFSDIWVLSAL